MPLSCSRTCRDPCIGLSDSFAHCLRGPLTTWQISLALGGLVYDPTDAVGRPRAGCVASSPSSTDARQHTSSPWCAGASTAPPRSPNRSASAARRSTAPSSARGSKHAPASRRPRDVNPAQRRRLSRFRHPSGMPAPRRLRAWMCGLCEVPCEHLTDDGEAHTSPSAHFARGGQVESREHCRRHHERNRREPIRHWISHADRPQ